MKNRASFRSFSSRKDEGQVEKEEDEEAEEKEEEDEGEVMTYILFCCELTISID